LRAIVAVEGRGAFAGFVDAHALALRGVAVVNAVARLAILSLPPAVTHAAGLRIRALAMAATGARALVLAAVRTNERIVAFADAEVVVALAVERVGAVFWTAFEGAVRPGVAQRPPDVCGLLICSLQWPIARARAILAHAIA